MPPMTPDQETDILSRIKALRDEPATEAKAAEPSAKDEQKARAEKYGIAAKDGGHLTAPDGYPEDPESYADPVNLKYPLDTEEHVRAAASYWGKAENKEGYSEDEQRTISDRIAAAEKRLGIGEEKEGEKALDADTDTNDAPQVDVAKQNTDEGTVTKDAPEEVDPETVDAPADETPVETPDVKSLDLETKAGRRLSAASRAKIQAIHDHAVDLLGGESDETDETDSDDEMGKMLTARQAELDRVNADVTERTKTLESLDALIAEKSAIQAEIETLRRERDELAATPVNPLDRESLPLTKRLVPATEEPTLTERFRN